MVAESVVRSVPQPMSAMWPAFGVALLAWRAFETGGDEAGMMRIVVGAIAIGALVLARRRTLAQRAALFVAIELVGGIATFAAIDVPLVCAHRTQIGALAVALYQQTQPNH